MVELAGMVWREAVAVAPAYLPLGLVGGWRWSVWLTKRLMAQLYRSDRREYAATVSVVTPVYNEDRHFFRRALSSWRNNGVTEIVAVIDHTDTACIAVFEEFAREFAGARLIVTEKPGKRPALADGIAAATSDIVALVDSDTVWEQGMLPKALAPFSDRLVGGVTVRQNVLHPRTLAQRLFNSQLNLRYFEEIPFLVALDGSTVQCLSGRTSLYRREAVMTLTDELVHETFWGQPVISGDDKRLTYLLQSRGWKVAYQQNARVYTPGEADMKTFLKQRLRWTRNSWRADLSALTQRWVWRKPYFALHLLDRAVQPFTLLLGPIYFVASLLLGLWWPALTLLAWWHVSRVVRLWPHLRRRPGDVVIVPAYVLLNYWSGLTKIYALFTLNRQGWMTRWDQSRLPYISWLRSGMGYAATAAMVVVLVGAVLFYKGEALGGEGTVAAHEVVAGEALTVAYDPAGYTLRVRGQGQAITLSELAARSPRGLFFEVAPGLWYVGAHVDVGRGVTVDRRTDRFEAFHLGTTPAGPVRLMGFDRFTGPV